MKIYIETEMTELPIICTACDICKVFERSQSEGGDLYSCNPDRKSSMVIKNPHSTKKPNWCPLRTETDIAEKAKEVKE